MLIIHIINIGVFLGDIFIIITLIFLKFIIIIFIHSIMVITTLFVIILEIDIIFGIKFIKFIVIKIVAKFVNISIKQKLFLFDFFIIK